MAEVGRDLRTESPVSVVVAENDVNGSGKFLSYLRDDKRGAQVSGMNQMSGLLDSSLLQGLCQIVQAIVTVREQRYSSLERQL